MNLNEKIKDFRDSHQNPVTWLEVKDVKKSIGKLNTRLENWKGNLTAQIVKEIEKEVFGRRLI